VSFFSQQSFLPSFLLPNKEADLQHAKCCLLLGSEEKGLRDVWSRDQGWWKFGQSGSLPGRRLQITFREYRVEVVGVKETQGWECL
jgi:hypothetical protein